MGRIDPARYEVGGEDLGAPTPHAGLKVKRLRRPGVVGDLPSP
jgi:hypothetical protein